MGIRIVLLEGDSIQATFRAPSVDHEWVAYPATAAMQALADQVIDNIEAIASRSPLNRLV